MCVTCGRHARAHEHTRTQPNEAWPIVFLLSLESRKKRLKEKAKRKGFCFGSVVAAYRVVFVVVVIAYRCHRQTIFYLLVKLSASSFLAGSFHSFLAGSSWQWHLTPAPFWGAAAVCEIWLINMILLMASFAQQQPQQHTKFRSETKDSGNELARRSQPTKMKAEAADRPRWSRDR